MADDEIEILPRREWLSARQREVARVLFDLVNFSKATGEIWPGAAVR